MTLKLQHAAVAVTLALASWGAQATDHLLGLAGKLADATTSSFDSGSTHYDDWQLGLSGLDTSNAITVSAGDTIGVLITFDGQLTVPASVNLTFYTVAFDGSGFLGDPVATSGHYTLNLAGVPILSAASNCSTSSQMTNCWVRSSPGDNGPITFDEVLVNFKVDTLSAPVSLDHARFSYTLFSPAAVPEPLTSSLMLAGLAALALKRRRAD